MNILLFNVEANLKLFRLVFLVFELSLEVAFLSQSIGADSSIHV